MLSDLPLFDGKAGARLLPDIQTHIPAMRRYALVLTRDADQAEDLVQESLSRAIAGVRSWRPGSNLSAWLLSILHNTFISGWRRERTERQALGEMVQAGLNEEARPPEQTASIELQQVMQALMTLPDGQREILVLAAVEGLSYREIADIHDVPLGTVMSRLARARDALRQALEARPVGRPRLRLVEAMGWKRGREHD
jgi:RNA polymerase sigma-70 factor (ECF subfamily)